MLSWHTHKTHPPNLFHLTRKEPASFQNSVNIQISALLNILLAKTPRTRSMPPTSAILQPKWLSRTKKPIPLVQHQRPGHIFPFLPLPRLELRRPAQANAQSSLPICCS